MVTGPLDWDRVRVGAELSAGISHMAKNDDGEGPKLASLKYQVSAVLGAEGNSTVLLVTNKDAVGGGKRYAVRVLKREDEKDDLPIEAGQGRGRGAASLS